MGAGRPGIVGVKFLTVPLIGGTAASPAPSAKGGVPSPQSWTAIQIPAATRTAPTSAGTTRLTIKSPPSPHPAGKTVDDGLTVPATPGNANRMWGGRFAAGPAAVMEQINASIGFDRRFYAQDIAASKAHAAMLVQQGIIRQEDGAAIEAGLDRVRAEIEAGRFEFKTALEDIHMNVEARLKEIIGEPAGRLHTARSRNDQVATDFRLWVRDALDQLGADLADLLAALLDRAEEYAATVMPGFTHLQPAQPVTFGHHLMAYVAMFE